MDKDLKNFNSYLADEDKGHKKDPNKYFTKEMKEQLQQMWDQSVMRLIYAVSAANVLTAPLQTLVSSLQLSVVPHKNIYQSQQNITKELDKLNTQLTIQEKRKLQLQITSGRSTSRPYTAPIYQGYRQAIYNLYQQGYSAFFKGLKLRVAHNALNLYPFFMLGASVDYNLIPNKLDYPLLILKQYFLHVICGMGTNVLQVAQNRYILQNNIQQMRVFRSFQVMFKKMMLRGDVFRGNIFHFINAGVQIFFRYSLYFAMLTSLSWHTHQSIIMYYYLSETFMFPVTTAYRRFISQSSVVPGMIPIRYESIRHALKVIFFEEGILGLWRGFGGYNIIIAIRLWIIKQFFSFNSIGSSQ